MNEAEENLLSLLCESFRTVSHVGRVEDGTLYELPLEYDDGTQIHLLLRDDGQVSDDGRTLVRLLGENRLTGFEEWKGFQSYCRVHHIHREGMELLVSGDPSKCLVHYIEGLRKIDSTIPRTYSTSKAFVDVVRRTVREKLDEEVSEGRLPEDVRDFIVKPDYSANISSGSQDQDRITIEIPADFRNREGDELFVVLSYGGSSPSRRMRHVRDRLAEHALIKDDSSIQSIAIIPDDGEYSGTEENLIAALTGTKSWRLDPETDSRDLVRRLIQSEGPFS